MEPITWEIVGVTLEVVNMEWAAAWGAAVTLVASVVAALIAHHSFSQIKCAASQVCSFTFVRPSFR